MLNISDEMIRRNTTIDIYRRGIEYYEKNKIKEVFYNYINNIHIFEAKVKGAQYYDIKINFNHKGDLVDTYCSCPYFSVYSGFCKHIVAVLKIIKKNDENGYFEQLNNNIRQDFIFNFFEQIINEHKKTWAELEVIYEFMNGEQFNKLSSSALSIKIGEKKLYVVSNLKSFLESNSKCEEYFYIGKDFSFEPSRHEFKPEDKPIIDFLQEIYENEKIAGNFSYTYYAGSIFKNKRVFLSEYSVKRFFNIMSNRSFKAIIFGKSYNNVCILNEELPICFNVTAESGKIILDVKCEEIMIPLTQDGEYFFMNGHIYKIPDKQRKYFAPFYYSLLLHNKKIIFTEQNTERFVSEVLPYIENIGKLETDQSFENIVHKEELDTEIYFDRIGDCISATVYFCYGERKINPFQGNKDNKDIDNQYNASQTILIRDIIKEKCIISIFNEAKFIVKKDKLHLEDQDKIYEFIFNHLPRLQELANIFYSEDFKSICIKPPSAFYGAIKLNKDSELLEFSFGIEGVDRHELVEILNCLKEKKKYYRLKDGSYLPMESKQLMKIAEIIDYLDLKKKDIEKEFIEIPKYRALYLEQKIKDEKVFNFIDRNNAFREFVKNIREPEDMDFKLPDQLKHTLRDYQKFGFKWLKTLSEYGLGGILADDMGLGKTLQILSLILYDKEKLGLKPSLIIVPTSLVYNWADEIEKFTPQLKYTAISGNKLERQKLIQEIKESDIVITSYPLIRRDIDLYSEINFRYCILDEAQHIKNPNTINAKSVKSIKAERRFALTGTPIENTLTELWSIFDFIIPGYLFSNNKFVKDYETPIVKYSDKKIMEDLSKQIRPFILRRLKSDVLKELPKKIESKMVAELSEEQKKIYLAYLKQAKGEIEREIEEKGFEKSHIVILSALTRLRQICCHPSLFIENFEGESGKMLLLKEILQDSIDSKHRILLFSQFTSMLAIIQDWLLKEKIEFMYLDGSTPAEERGKLVKSFNNGKGDIFLISLKSGGTGLNLTGADMVIHFDPWWNPAVEEQATDRAYRIGQNKSVQVIKMITKGTIEEKIFLLQETKKQLINSIIQPGETLLSKFTKEEIRALFE